MEPAVQLYLFIPKREVREVKSINKEKQMKKVTMIIMAIFLGALLASCASQDMVKKGEMDAKKFH